VILYSTPCCSADRSGGQLDSYTTRAGPGQYDWTDVQTLILSEARARLSGASTGGACSWSTNIYV